MLCEDSKNSGISYKRSCELLQISLRRVQRWRRRETLEDYKPGPITAPHKLLPEERSAIIDLACSKDYEDETFRALSVIGADNGLFNASASTVYRVMREERLTTDRSGKRRNSGNYTKPERKEIDGPNQRWCWDISYLTTHVKGIYLYLYVLLDEYSRKAISWRVSWNLSYKEGKELLQEGLDNEGLNDIDIDLPELFNDRGGQMKAVNFINMCKRLGILQKFSRPRTPNDNPFIEAFFAVVKKYHKYPEYFKDDIEAITYFSSFMPYYNNDKLHGSLGYVTPVQKHNGEDVDILKKRKKGLIDARMNRISKNKERRAVNNVASI